MNRINDLIRKSVIEDLKEWGEDFLECFSGSDIDNMVEEEIQEGFGYGNQNSFSKNDFAKMEYQNFKKRHSHLKSSEFLQEFNLHTEGDRSIIPYNFPLTQRDFQEKIMYEKRKDSSLTLMNGYLNGENC